MDQIIVNNFNNISKLFFMGMLSKKELYHFVRIKMITELQFELITKENFATFQENLLKMHLQNSEKL